MVRRLPVPRPSSPRLEILEARHLLSATVIELGPSDNIALDQPRVTVLLSEDAGTPTQLPEQQVGPDFYSTFLLDTGANSILAMASAVGDMTDPELTSTPYRTEGTFREIGVAGDHLFDIGAPYYFSFSGSDYVHSTMSDVRILSDPVNDFSIAGPWGLAGMPVMSGRVTSFDFTGWSGGLLDDLSNVYMGVAFGDTVPDTTLSRLSVSLDNRIAFDPTAQVESGDYPPTWADVPFLTATPVHQGVSLPGNFLFDTGAQISIISSRMALSLGLDSNGDGVLDAADLNYVTGVEVGGVGGAIEAPVFAIDAVHIPTDQGVDLVWTDLQWLVLDIDTGPDQLPLDGIFGSDLLTSGWFTAAFEGGPDGYLAGTHLDFRDWASTGTGKLYLDLTQSVTLPDPGPVVNDQSFDVAENSATGTVAGAVLASHPDTAQVLTYAVTAGNPGGVFAINSLTGTLSVADGSQLDFEGTARYSLTVEVRDNGDPARFDTATITVRITNVNEAPTGISLSSTAIDENVAAGSVVGTFSTADPDVADSHTYSLVGDAVDNGFFSLAGDQLTILSSPDFEARSSYTIRVHSTDADSNVLEQDFVISIVNVNEAPTADDGTTSTSEDTAVSIDLRPLVHDAETGDAALTYTISNLTGGTFTADPGQNGLFTFAPTPNFSGAAGFTYRVNDGVADSNPAAVTVTVTAVNDPPVSTVPSDLTATGGTLGGISIADPDAGSSTVQVTFRVSAGTLTLNTAVEEGVSADQVSGNGSSTVVVSAPLTDLNTTLADAAGLRYTAPAGFIGVVLLTLTAQDPATGSDTTVTDATIQVGATISGQVFVDSDGDGVRDPGELGHPPVPVVVYLDRNWNGRLDVGERRVVSVDGHYSFTYLRAGTYVVRQLVPPGWIRTTPRAAGTPVTVAANQEVPGPDFGNFQRGRLSGRVFIDINGNGTDDGEPGRFGFRVFLDRNNDGRLNLGERVAYTTPTGAYSFLGLGPGAYTVRPVVPAGWLLTAPEERFYSVVMTSGLDAGGNTFGYFKRATLAGRVLTVMGLPMAGVQVDLLDAAGVVVRSVLTGRLGTYSFAGLGPGTYTVRQAATPPGWEPVPLTPDSYERTVTSGLVVGGLTFRNQRIPVASPLLRALDEVFASGIVLAEEE